MMRNKLFYLLIVIFFFSYSYKKKYNKKDISEIIEVSLHEVSFRNRFPPHKTSIEFVPMSETFDRQYLERNLLDRPFIPPFLGGSLEDEISKADIDYMLENQKRLVKKQKKISDYITCTDNCISTDSLWQSTSKSTSKKVDLFKDNDYIEIIYLPYININHDLAMIRHEIHTRSHADDHCILLKKIKGNWRVIGKF